MKNYCKILKCRPYGLLILVLLLSLFILPACGTSRAEIDQNEEPQHFRAPSPTFTPTPIQQAPAPAAAAPVQQSTQPAIGGAVTAQNESQPIQADAGQPPSGGAIVVINSPLVNVRSGPNTDSEVLGTVERGQEFEIIGRNAVASWWQVCCVDGTSVWVIDEYVDTDGAVDAVPITSGVGQEAAIPAEDAPSVAAPVAQQQRFELITQEQFPETTTPRIFLYVYQGNESLPGYSLRITKDGVELPVEAKSFGGQPAFTWPFQDPRQRYQNLKIEFPDVDASGNWQIELVDDSGNIVGSPAQFNLTVNDPEQEMYVRYERQ